MYSQLIEEFQIDIATSLPARLILIVIEIAQVSEGDSFPS